MQNPLPIFFSQHRIPLHGQRFLLAVSGGLDSAVLCCLAREAGLSFAIAHMNFGLRGAESDRDEAFVQGLAKQYGVPCFTRQADAKAHALQNGIGVQEAARDLRYQWFHALCKDGGFSYTLLAHQADDNIETTVMNFFRGTGLAGLTGMPERTEKPYRLLRPLLDLRREQLADFARERQLSWVEDSSNAEGKYTRNLFRLQVLPLIEKAFPQAAENVLRNQKRLSSVAYFYGESMEALKEKLVERQGGDLRIACRKLLRYRHTPVLFEILRGLGFGEKQVEEAWKLCEAPSGRYIQNAEYQVVRHRAWLVLARRSAEAGTVVIEAGQPYVPFRDGQLAFGIIERPHWKLDPSPQVAQLDADLVPFPLLLRTWRSGDYFYPLGLRKKKKLARFLIDARLSKADKERTWVIESAQRIAWIAGRRIDDRFRVTEKTKRVLRIELLPTAQDKT